MAKVRYVSPLITTEEEEKKRAVLALIFTPLRFSVIKHIWTSERAQSSVQIGEAVGSVYGISKVLVELREAGIIEKETARLGHDYLYYISPKIDQHLFALLESIWSKTEVK